MVFKTHCPGLFLQQVPPRLPGVANNVASVDPKELWNNSSDTASGLWRDFVFLDSEKRSIQRMSLGTGYGGKKVSFRRWVYFTPICTVYK